MAFLWFYLAYLVSLINKTEIFSATKGLETSHLLFSWLLGSLVEAKSCAAKAGFELLTTPPPLLPPKSWNLQTCHHAQFSGICFLGFFCDAGLCFLQG